MAIQPNDNIALVSVIVSGCVALASLLAPVITGLLVDRAKWKRESKAREIETIDSSTVAVLRAIADANTRVGATSSPGEWNKRHAEVEASYYAWERAIWNRCTPAERNEVKGIRPLVQSRSYDEITGRILEISHGVRERFD